MFISSLRSFWLLAIFISTFFFRFCLLCLAIRVLCLDILFFFLYSTIAFRSRGGLRGQASICRFRFRFRFID
uniref:Uncharacterized protein n=1 Tax=Anopheles darlingi TaxID=43151 RepID=A0A2M4D5F9_ANODA